MNEREGCIDCNSNAAPNEMFYVVPAAGHKSGGGRPFKMCRSCWDSMVGDAMLTRIRSGGAS